MGQAGGDWTEATLKKAAALWKDGKSAAQIGEAIGRSRNAVLGKAHRMPELFPARGERRPSVTVRRVVEKLRGPRSSPVRVKSEPAPRPPRPPKPVPAEVPDGWIRERGEPIRNDLSVFALPGIDPVAFIDLGRDACRFPLQAAELKAGPSMPCCGAKTEDGKSYCEAHHAVMTRRVA